MHCAKIAWNNRNEAGQICPIRLPHFPSFRLFSNNYYILKYVDFSRTRTRTTSSRRRARWPLDHHHLPPPPFISLIPSVHRASESVAHSKKPRTVNRSLNNNNNNDDECVADWKKLKRFQFIFATPRSSRVTLHTGVAILNLYSSSRYLPTYLPTYGATTLDARNVLSWASRHWLWHIRYQRFQVRIKMTVYCLHWLLLSLHRFWHQRSWSHVWLTRLESRPSIVATIDRSVLHSIQEVPGSFLVDVIWKQVLLILKQLLCQLPCKH